VKVGPENVQVDWETSIFLSQYPTNPLKSTGVSHGIFSEIDPTTIPIAKPELIEFKDEPIADYHPNVSRSIRNNRA
jgi:hypothetical protein